jgi:hypothetical protein
VKPKLLLTGLLVVLSIACFSQSHGVSLNTNFLITQTPVFQLGYEYHSDSSAFSYVLNVDAGRYQHTADQLFFSSIDDYTLTGFGIMPEARYYPFQKKLDGAFGVILAAYARVHRYKSTEQKGIAVENNALVIDQPSIVTSRFNAINAGLALGYRSRCVANTIYLEILGGWHPLITEFGRGQRLQPASVYANIRAELNLVALF